MTEEKEQPAQKSPPRSASESEPTLNTSVPLKPFANVSNIARHKSSNSANGLRMGLALGYPSSASASVSTPALSTVTTSMTLSTVSAGDPSISSPISQPEPSLTSAPVASVTPTQGPSPGPSPSPSPQPSQQPAQPQKFSGPTAVLKQQQQLQQQPQSQSQQPQQPQPQPQYQQQQQGWPALHLLPINDTFIPKQISLLPPGNRIKIGRQTNAKTAPAPNNGYFDSKVLSRTHAEVWYEPLQNESPTSPPGPGKVYIKDVGSSNGTFINGERLSLESVKSEVFELHSDDTVEFGIDIASEDNRTILHHKVAAKVHLALTPEDSAILNQRVLPAWTQRQSQAQQEGFSMRRMSRAGVASTGLSFDHVLSRLQSELQKSRETGNELSQLTSTMQNMQQTLGGHGPPLHLPTASYPRLPAVQQQQATTTQQQPQQDANLVASLQSQLNEAQANLSTQADRMKSLEGLLEQHEAMKQAIGELREQMRAAQHGMESLIASSNHHARIVPASMDDFDDTRSNATTLMPDSDGDNGATEDTLNLERAGDFDDEMDALDMVNPPNGVLHGGPSVSSHHPLAADPILVDLKAQNAVLTARLEEITAELEAATFLGNTLKQQHEQAANAMSSLEVRLVALETAVSRTSVPSSDTVVEKQQVKLEDKWEGWKAAFESSWLKDKQEWARDRERLQQLVADWETKALPQPHDATDRDSDAQNTSMLRKKGRKRKSRKQRSSGDDTSQTGGESDVSQSPVATSDLSDVQKAMTRDPGDAKQKQGQTLTLGSTQSDPTPVPAQTKPTRHALIRDASSSSSASSTTFRAVNGNDNADGDVLNHRPSFSATTSKRSSGTMSAFGAVSVVAVALAAWSLSHKD